MKKLLLSGLVIMIFLAYSYHQRQEEAGAVIAPIRPAAATQTAKSNQTSAKTPAAPPPTSPNPSSVPVPTPAPAAANSGKYKNGSYTGTVADAFYGLVQVQAVIQNGNIASINFLQYPNENRTSRLINSQAVPMLQEEVVQAQSSQVDIITGATETSSAFIQSLTAALSHAS